MNLGFSQFLCHCPIKFLWVLFLLICLASPVRAEFSPDISMHEKAVFAYFKTTRGQPFFDQWIKSSEPYRTSAALAQDEIYEHELLRLKWGFGVYDETADFLAVNTQVYLQLSNGAEGPLLNFKFLNSADQEIPFFPYQYGDEWIALIVNDLHLFTSVPLDAEQHQKIASLLEAGKIYEGMIRIRARPVTADAEMPLEMPDGKYWLLMGDTAYIEFLYAKPGATEPVKLWHYTAPWYLSENEEILLDLLDNKKQ